jgi:hypothetical protein
MGAQLVLVGGSDEYRHKLTEIYRLGMFFPCFARLSDFLLARAAEEL